MSDKIGRKTTPEHCWMLPTTSENIEDVLLTYSQNGVILVEKTLNDVNICDNQLIYKLTQEETFKFQPCFDLDMQLEVKTVGGDILQSDVITLSVARCLNERLL